MELKWKTRGGVNPGKKSKVFFCCHEADFSVYFEEIAKDILQLQDCAIWYRDALPAADDEEYRAALEQMQLFVMPVTTRLLTTETSALTVDYAIAQEAHIPVLPLMQESGLENLFNAKCGTLQFLDKYGQDATALKFEDKLGQFLKAVLVGDEQAEKIRAAFDAYIFLSYRKKDRRYAQELMRLIHKNEFARDVAIWYDEFLTPGEDFNDAIGAALDKSVLYALTVTPNLLEQGNYIMEHEFPAAMESGKPILPVEMQKTDRQALEQVYQGVPAPIDSGDDGQLVAALTDALQSIALQEKANDPEHNFFIGLAYLGGIDVERDPSRAVGLITSAAESGLPEAMDKLSRMYDTGDGVARDFYKGVEWQERLVEYRKQVWERTGAWRDGDDYAYELRWLATSYQELRMEEKAVVAAQTLYEIVKDKSWGWDHRYYAAVVLGDIAKENRRMDEAKQWYELGLQSAEEKGDRAYTGQKLMLNRLLLLAIMELKFDGAERYAKRFLEITQERCKTNDDRESVLVALLNLGSIYEKTKQTEQALRYVLQALDLARVCYEEKRDGNSASGLGNALSQCASCYQALGDLDTADAYRRESTVIWEETVENTGSFTDRLGLIDSYRAHSILLADKGCLKEAQVRGARACAMAQQLVKETDIAETRRALAKVYATEGYLFIECGKIEQAKQSTERALALYAAVGYESVVGDMVGMIGCCEGMARALQEEKNYAEAIVYCRYALQLVEQKTRLWPAESHQNDLFCCHCNLAIGYGNLKQLAQTEEHCKIAMEIGLAARDEITSDSWNLFLKSYTHVLRRDIDYMDGAGFAVCETYLRVCEWVDEKDRDNEYWNNLGLVLFELAQCCIKQKDYDRAASCYRRHNFIRERLVQESGALFHKRGLADGLYNLAELLPGTQEAIELYEQALPLYRQCAKYADEDRLSALYRASVCGTELGRRKEQQGQREQAEVYFEEAERYSGQVAKQTDKSGDRRRWAACLTDAANMHLKKGDLRQAEKRLRKAEELYQDLVNAYAKVQDRGGLAIVWVKLGECAQAKGDTQATMMQFSRAANLLREIMAEENSIENRVNYTACLERMAQVYQTEGDKQAAREVLEEVLPIREACYREDPSGVHAMNLVQAYQNLFFARIFMADAQLAADACDRAIEVLETLAETAPQTAEPPLAMNWLNRSMLCAKEEDERWCLEQAAELAMKYPNYPTCQTVIEKLPDDLRPKKSTGKAEARHSWETVR